MKIKNKKGFTLAELLIVVAIIAVLVAVAIPIFTSQLEKARQAVDLQNARAIQSALTNAYNTGEIDLGNCKHGEGVWVLICRDESSKPSGYNNAWNFTYNNTLFCGADANTIIKGRKVTKVSYENEIEQILKEYGINVDSLKIKSSKDSNKNKGWDWIVIQMVNKNGIAQSCMFSGFAGISSAYNNAYGKNTDNLNKIISGNR